VIKYHWRPKHVRIHEYMQCLTPSDRQVHAFGAEVQEQCNIDEIELCQYSKDIRQTSTALSGPSAIF
jgi:hypothetical protein